MNKSAGQIQAIVYYLDLLFYIFFCNSYSLSAQKKISVFLYSGMEEIVIVTIVRHQLYSPVEAHAVMMQEAFDWQRVLTGAYRPSHSETGGVLAADMEERYNHDWEYGLSVQMSD